MFHRHACLVRDSRVTREPYVEEKVFKKLHLHDSSEIADKSETPNSVRTINVFIHIRGVSTFKNLGQTCAYQRAAVLPLTRDKRSIMLRRARSVLTTYSFPLLEWTITLTHVRIGYHVEHCTTNIVGPFIILHTHTHTCLVPTSFEWRDDEFISNVITTTRQSVQIACAPNTLFESSSGGDKSVELLSAHAHAKWLSKTHSGVASDTHNSACSPFDSFFS